MNFLSFLFYWFPVAVWASLIYYLSSIPGLSTGWGIWDLILRKCAHVFEYFVLTLLLLRASRKTWTSLSPRGVAILSGLVSLLYAASDEIHQAFVPRRGPSVYDVLIDSVGIVFCLFLYHRFFCSKEHRYSA